MKPHILILIMCPLAWGSEGAAGDDAAHLAGMIAKREQAMVTKDIETAMSQFSDDATWINSQGYYFEGRDSVREFHAMLAGSATRDYHYEAGKPRIRLLDPTHAIVYYSWNMRWFDKADPDVIVHDEIGLMTLIAQKRGGRWQWVAVTNQHTPWFYEAIDPVTVDEG